MDPTLVPDGGLPWLEGSGPLGHLVVSTRVRLARNLAGHRFRGRNDPAEREAVLREVLDGATEGPEGERVTCLRLDALSRSERVWLEERQLISPELAAAEGADPGRSGAALLLGRDHGILVNEEDHLRVQAFRSGFALEEAWRAAARADAGLGVRLSFAFHPEFGYLTSCPTNVGTGLRASVLIHLPGLVLTREIGKVLHGLVQVGLTHRGLHGEESEVLGNLFQLSNHTTLGKSEEELLDHLGRLVRQVMDSEERARAVLRRDAPHVLDDKVWRAWGLLRHARTLTFDETVNLLSGVRLGVAMSILPPIPLDTLNRLLVMARTAHVARDAGFELDDDLLPVHRATVVRRWLAEAEERR